MAKLTTPKCEQCGKSLSCDLGNRVYVCQGTERHVMTSDRFWEMKEQLDGRKYTRQRGPVT